MGICRERAVGLGGFSVLAQMMIMVNLLFAFAMVVTIEMRGALVVETHPHASFPSGSAGTGGGIPTPLQAHACSPSKCN